MIVAEMIAELQKHPPDAPVLVADWNEEYREPFPATLTTDEEHHRGAVIVTAMNSAEILENTYESS